jgi:O-antigen biosynthesis protein WbqP
MRIKKKLLDIVLIVFISPFVMIFIFFISILIFVLDNKPVFFMSPRVGYKNKIFFMYKFRTMKNNTPLLAKHLLNNPKKYTTNIGSFLRKSSLDELPQIFNILKGEMSFVGPRPALFNQYNLIKKRTKFNIHSLYPGITGLAQVNGRDKLSVNKKIKYDILYKKNFSILTDVKIIIKTIQKLINTKDITH